MQPPSDHTKGLIGRLYLRRTFWQRLTRQRAEQCQLLEEIALAGESAAIAHVAPLLLSKHDDVATAAAQAVQRLMAAVPVTDYSSLDESFRFNSGWYYFPEEYWYRPAFARFEQLAEKWPAVLAIVTFHPSGFLREQALRSLCRQTSGAELPFLLLRVNDWVAPIRALSAELIRDRLVPGYGRHFIENLPLVVRLAGCGRGRHRELVDEIFWVMRDASSEQELLASLDSPERVIRRGVFRLAVEVVCAATIPMIRHGLRHRDHIIRLLAIRAARTHLNHEEVKQVVEQAVTDPFMPIRREALFLVMEFYPAELAQHLRRALLDPHPALQEVARYYLGKGGDADFAAFYRQALKGEGNVSAAIRGLGATGTPEDGELLLVYLDASSAKVRSLALRALATLARDSYREFIVAALTDGPGVSRQARNLLAEDVRPGDQGWLWQLVQQDQRHYVRKHALSLITALPRWDNIRYLLRAVAHEDKELADLALRNVQEWVTASIRLFRTPTPAQLADINQAFVENEEYLPGNLRSELSFILASRRTSHKVPLG